MKKPVAKRKAVVKKSLTLSDGVKKHVIKTSYLNAVYSKSFLKNIPLAVKRIREFRKKHPFDAIAFSGSSGAGYAFPLSYLMKIPLIHVRKDGSSENYYQTIEGTVSSKRYLIVDDFISSGDTMRRIIEEIDSNIKHKPQPVGIFLYTSNGRDKFFSRKKIPIIRL